MSEHFNAKGKQFNCVRPRTKWWLSDENGKYYVSPKNGHLKFPVLDDDGSEEKK